MTELVERRSGVHTTDEASARLRRRYAAEKRFQLYGMASISVAVIALVLLLGTVISNGWSGFLSTSVSLEVMVAEDLADPGGKRLPEDLNRGDYQNILRAGLRGLFPEITSRGEQRSLYGLVSPNAGDVLRDMVVANPALVGQKIKVTVPAGSDYDMLAKGYIKKTTPASERRLTDQQIGWFEKMEAAKAVSVGFNTYFLSNGDSREPEVAGVWGAVTGSLLTLSITLMIAFPLGVMTAVYLEEFAPKNRWTDLIEVNINNLAAVPSIVFGLLGLAVFLQFFGMPRSAPVAGGVVLALMSLPVIIIAARAALRAVPPSIRQAALGLGASKIQTVTHHVLPLAMPGILTGTILSMAHALGETAPLLMIGMVAFIVNVPTGFTDAATVLPVQIYLWADSPERGFVEKTSAAILVLLAFLLMMNAIAIYLRKKFERSW